MSKFLFVRLFFILHFCDNQYYYHVFSRRRVNFPTRTRRSWYQDGRFCPEAASVHRAPLVEMRFGTGPQQHCGAQQRQSVLSVSALSQPNQNGSQHCHAQPAGLRNMGVRNDHVWPLLLTVQPPAQGSSPGDPLAS